MTKKSTLLLHFSRLFVGLLFIFSGLIKANDPIGFGYKLEEYFEVFSLHFLIPLATALAIILCALEILLGIMLLLGIYTKKVAWGLLILILFFTILTFSSAVFEIVTSCGCFGDAIPISPWQSFIKDLILGVFILIIFFKKGLIKPVFKPRHDKILTIIFAFISLSIGVYTFCYGPKIDFLPYQIGANIPSLMKIPEGAPIDIYEIKYHLKNKKTAEEKDMTDKQYLDTEIWKDENWEIVGEPSKRLIKKGFEVKIKDLKITDDQGNDYTESLLSNPFPNFWLVAYNLHQSSKEELTRLISNLKEIQKVKNTRFILLTATAPKDIKNNFPMLNDVEIYYVDAVPLKSMVRSNPGVLLLEKGTILKKWTHLAFPNSQTLIQNYFTKK